ncbi:MAG: PAS domain-containing protein [Candidatus Thorarchaeota archaeon]|nr:MAG: PAS domain-containing protein [Candidatus Thorarchaeota archaeon]
MDSSADSRYARVISSLANLMNAAVIVTDLDGRLLMATDRAVKLLGAEDESEIVGKSGFDWLAPEDRQAALNNLLNVAEKGSKKNQRYVLTQENGSKQQIELDSALMRLPDGQPEGFVLVIRSIGEPEEDP